MNDNLQRVGIIGGFEDGLADDYLPEIHKIIKEELGNEYNADVIQWDLNRKDILKKISAQAYDGLEFLIDDIVINGFLAMGVCQIAPVSDKIQTLLPSLCHNYSGSLILMYDCLARRCVEEIGILHDKYPEIYGSSTEPKRVLVLGMSKINIDAFGLRDYFQKYNLDIITLKIADSSYAAFTSNSLQPNKRNDDAQERYIDMIARTIEEQPIDAIALADHELSLFCDEFTLAHLDRLKKLNHERPFVVAEIKKSHIIGIAKSCLGQWETWGLPQVSHK